MSWRPRPRILLRQGLSLLMVGELMFPNTPMAMLPPAWSPLPTVLSVSGVLHRAASWLLRQSTPPPRQQTQDDRNATVAALEISPGNVTVAVGQPVFFVASALDNSGEQVAGVPVLWTAQNTGTQQSVPIAQGMFVADTTGTFLVQANALSYSAQVTVTAVQQLVQPAIPGDEGGWGRDGGRDYTGIASSPSNRHGRPWQDPDSPPLETPPPARDLPGNSNFEVGIPLVSLPGRGLPLSLSLRYNSQLWTTADSTKVVYNIDGDWPAPGWQLGFGKLMLLNYSNPLPRTATALLWEPDGTRRILDGAWTSTRFTGTTSDGSNIACTANIDRLSEGGWSFTDATVRYPNGTVVQYAARDASTSTSRVYPVRITDANGNYVSITYVNSQGFDQGPRINLIQDTLGREIDFHYDSAGLLVALSAPDFNTSTRREVVRFNYQQVPITGTFPGHPTRDIIGGSPAWAIASLYFPATSTGYWFDSYSFYGQLTSVKEHTGMQFSGARCQRQEPCAQGVISSGIPGHTKEYAFVLLNDELTYNQMTESWRSMDTPDAAITGYARTTNGTTLRLDTTLPNGAVVSTLSYTGFTDTEAWKNGVVYQTSVYRDASLQGLLQSTLIASWDANIGSRPTRIDRTDERGQMTRTDFVYSARGEVTDVKEYDYGGVTVLRTTHTDYVTAQAYADRWHFNLPTAVEVLDASGARASRTEYTYDEHRCRSLANALNVTQHSADFDPYQTPCDASNPNNLRGNASTIKRYVDATNSVTENISYDITGNVVSFSASCCELTSLQYTANTQFAQPESKTRGARDVIPSARVTTSAMYDFNTGLVISSTNENGIPTQTDYFAGSLRPRKVTLYTNATREFAYDDNNLSLTSTAKTSEGAVAAQVVSRLNGLGKLRRQETSAEWVTDPWDKVEYQYDTMGRLSAKSRPFHQEADTRQWTRTSYDLLSRVTQVMGPGSAGSVQYFYNEPFPRPRACSPAPGQTVRTADAWGRGKWSRTDALGRLAEVVEPDPVRGLLDANADNTQTLYFYNALGGLVDVLTGSQRRYFRYDYLGRLTHQKLAEKAATLNDFGLCVTVDDSGNCVGNGSWSDVFTYDSRSNLTSHTDARGAITRYNYNNAQLEGMLDPLNRLQTVSYVIRGRDTATLPTPSVSYTYRPNGAQPVDVTQVASIATDGVVTETFGYDAEGRVSSRNQTFSGWPTSMPLLTEFTPDSLGRLQDMRYPAHYGMPTELRHLLHHDYDVQSRPKGLKVDGVDEAASVTYNEASQVSSLQVDSLWETFNYEPDTGLLNYQSVASASGVTPLEISYSYARQGLPPGKTGQLTELRNNRFPEESQRYQYDALGRLASVAGGPTQDVARWHEDYQYDRYGNRTSVQASSLDQGAPECPADGCGPRNLQGVPTPESQVYLWWQNHGPGSIAVERSSDGQNFQTLATVSASVSAYRDDNVPAGAQYYRLSYLPLDSGRGVPPVPVQVPPQPANMLPPPQGFTATAVASTRILLSWSLPQCGEGEGGRDFPTAYVLERVEASGQATFLGSWPCMPSGSVAMDSQLLPLTTYNYRLRQVAVNPPDPLPSLYVFAQATTPQALSPPSGLTATSLPQLQVELDWVYNGADAIDGFIVERQANPVGTFHEVARVGPNARQYVDSPSAGIPYAYRVASYRGQYDVSEYSSTSAQLPLPTDGVASTSYDAVSNRITNTGFQYDATGNPTRAQRDDGTWLRLQYDAAGRLVNVMDDSFALLETYTYGAGRHRLVTQNASGDKTYFVWNGDSVLAEYEWSQGTATPKWKRSYVYLGSRLLSTRTRRTTDVGDVEWTEYRHSDRLGTRLITRGGGTEVHYQQTLPFGTALQVAGSAQTSNRLFTSYDRSQSTGLDNAVNRNYSSPLGRFLQVDPIGMASVRIGAPQSLNLYSYGGNDPINTTDPSGLLTPVLLDGILLWLAGGNELPDGGGETIVVNGQRDYRPFGIPLSWSEPGRGWDAGPDDAGERDGGRGGGGRDRKQTVKPHCEGASPSSPSYPFGPWSSADEAVINTYNYIVAMDPRYPMEYAGRLYSFDEGHYAMPPRQMFPEPSPIRSYQWPVRRWGTDEGGYHSHTWSEDFSRTDMTPRPSLPEYLLTHLGDIKKYDPTTGRTTTISKCQ